MIQADKLPKVNALGLPVSWYAHCDGNSFYCSCEASVKPWIADRPIIVASNNDLVAIALNRKAKSLGFKMGDLLFQIPDKIKEHGVLVFSSNYEAYGDISSRMHAIFASFTSDYETYSIDEGFLSMTGMEHMDFEQYGRQIIRTTYKGIRIPICLGIAQTKTLAKAANKLAKGDTDRQGLYIIATEEDRVAALKKLPIGDVWGIGRQYEKMLQSIGVNTAYDFACLDRSFVRKKMHVTGERVHKELNGIECISLELYPPDKQEICTSRAFPARVTEFDEVRAAIVRYLSSCARKLRRQKSYAKRVYVSIHTNNFNENQPQYHRGIQIDFPVATNVTSEMMPYAIAALKAIWPRYSPGQPLYKFKKTGVTLSGIIPAANRQLSLFFDPVKDRAKAERLQQVVDEINGELNLDSRLIIYGAEVTRSNKTKLRREMKSLCPTIKWEDRIVIKMG